MPSLVQVAKLLGVDDLTVLFELRILGQPRGQADVPEELVPTLRVLLGAPGPEASEATPLEAHEPSPHRRLLRRICGKLASQGKWSPNGMLVTTIARGFPDAGEVRAALEVMRKAGWVVVAAERRGYGDTLYALNPEVRPAIAAAINDPESPLPRELATWSHERVM